jgi:hypothetical protein
MNEDLSVPVDEIIEQAVEFWRLKSFLEKSGNGELAPAVRHYTRRAEGFFGKYGIGLVDLTGQKYEPGLAVEVIETVEARKELPAAEIIVEMTEPVVLFREKVIRHGRAVISRPPKSV